MVRSVGTEVYEHQRLNKAMLGQRRTDPYDMSSDNSHIRQ
jgi:hypothetical protein